MGIIRTIQTDLTKSALQLIVECRERLYSIAYRECGNAADAEDLVSQTIAKAIQKLDGNTEVENLFAWLRAMMLNLRKDEMRRAVVRGTQPVESEKLESYAGADWSTDEKILKDSDSEAIHQAIEELDPKYRQAMLMRYYEDFSFKEIAQILKLPMGTVSRRIQIAHHLLAAKLGSKLGRKPIAVLLAALLGVGTLFGAWQAGVAMIEAMSDDGRAVSMKPPTTENNQTTLTTTKEEPPMNTIKGTLLAAATAVSLMSTAQADEPTGPIPVTPDTMESSGAGTVIKVDGDYVLSFTNTANTYTFTIPNDVKSIRYLVVAGGGAGGGYGGGGGGAGGMLEESAYAVSAGDILTINVGKGGARQTGSGAGDNGKDSSITNGTAEVALAYGGGGGGSTPSKASPDPAKAGGSGGGANGRNASGVMSVCNGGATKGDNQGNVGGGVEASSVNRVASGGGGAGTSGGTSTGYAVRAGGGGDGRVSDITGSDVTYAGGGGGAGYYYGGGEGGSKIGGDGGDYNSGFTAEQMSGKDGKDGFGGGGGGCYKAGGDVHSGKGGDGIVIIRYTPPAAAKAKVHFSYDPNTATWVATTEYGETIENDAEVDDGATVTVVATPKDGYEYASAPEGWAKNEDDTVTADFVVKAPECTIQIPAATAIPFTMNFTPGANASYTATVDGQPVQNGAKIRTGKQIVVVATPNTDCEYTAIPEGWNAGEVEGTITRTITAGEGVPQLTIPDAAAIDYVQVQFTSNGSAFFEATNAVGEKVEGRVRAGTEVFVKIWAGVGFVYNETPTGWTLEAEGDAYTKAFTAVSGSTLTIQIPNAKELGGKWTKEIPANIGYKLEVEKDLVFVFTNTAAEGCEMILPSGVTSLRYLVVGGGGAGGQGNGCCGGGGGAGGMLTNNEFKVIGRMLKINVGKGGVGADGCGADGKDSVLVNGAGVIRAFGGGGGGGGRNQSDIVSPNPGGSGGGGNGSVSNARKIFAGAAAMVAEDGRTQGHAGGGVAYDSKGAISASGGGGAGGKGGDGSSPGKGGDGGAGLLCDITGEDNKYYAAGGGGACYDGYKDAGVGGSGIGGNGGKSAAGDPGVDGTGSGGGGARNNGASGKGGDGVVIIRFAKPKGGVIIFLM